MLAGSDCGRDENSYPQVRSFALLTVGATAAPMAFEDLYAQLAAGRKPVDLRELERVPEEPDSLVYRLGHSSVPIAGMPERCSVGRVEIIRTVGPVLSQRTLLRQRHGVPIVFDKSMQLEVEIGENEVLTICQIKTDLPVDRSGAFADWREEAQSALGILAAALDERVAIDERFEDAIGLKDDKPVNSSDARNRLRNFLPFDVTDEERATLAELASLQTNDLVPLAEAARWYLKAAQEGPTADAVVYMWIAIEALTPHRTTSPKTVEAMLITAGFHPEILGDITVGKLAGLRAEIVHQGSRDHPLIRQGFYRLETIVRVLIRNAAGITSSWAPVLSRNVFHKDVLERPEFRAQPEIVWHEEGLPAPDDPQPAGFEWHRVQVPMAQGVPPMEIHFEGELQPGWQVRANHWISRAVEVLEIEFEPIRIEIHAETEAVPSDVEMAANHRGLLLRPELFTLPNPQRELALAKLIQEGLAQVAVMRLGIASESFGTTLVATGGSWALYRAFYKSGGPFEGEDLSLREVQEDDFNGLGMLLGAALAGSPAAVQALTTLGSGEPTPALVATTLLRDWGEITNFPQLLGAIQAVADEFKRLSTD